MLFIYKAFAFISESNSFFVEKHLLLFYKAFAFLLYLFCKLNIAIWLLQKAIAFVLKSKCFFKKKTKKKKKKSPTPPIKEKEKEKEKDDDSYVRACACVRGWGEKKKGNAIFRHCHCVLSETFALLTFIYDDLLLVTILNLELHNASHWHIVWDERHQLCNYLVHVTETDVLHFA